MQKMADNQPVDDDQVSALLTAFQEYKAKIAWTISRIVGPHEIEDILQEAFVRSVKAAKVTRIRKPGPFLLRTARNLALNHVSSAAQRLTDQIEDFPVPDVPVSTATETVESDVEAKERFLLFCQALRTVPVKCRRVFILKKIYGMSQREIARHLGISESTVEKHVAKGLLLCSEYMAEFEQRAGRNDSSSSGDKAG